MTPAQPAETTVHLGRDDWLFLVGGSNDVASQYEAEAFPQALRADWRRLLEQRTQLARHFGGRYLNIVVPEKLSVYENRLDHFFVDTRLSPARRLHRSLWFSPARRSNLDLLRLFRRQRERIPLYLKTDTHWTFAGCDLAYRAICRRLRARPRSDLGDPDHRETARFLGDLGNKLDPPRFETVERWAYPRKADRFHADERVLGLEAEGEFVWGGGSGTHVAYRNEAEGIDRRRMLLVGDSHSSHAWQPFAGSLTAMLAETFFEVHFIWSSGVDWNYVEAMRPDVVLTEMAERYLVRPRFLAIEAEAIRAMMEKHGLT